jgi:hypothetical protein
MEIAKNELAAIEALASAKKDDVTELVSLELTLVGGGMGDIVL